MEQGERIKEGKESLWKSLTGKEERGEKSLLRMLVCVCPDGRQGNERCWLAQCVTSSSSCWKCHPLEVFPGRKEKPNTTMHSFLYETEFTKDLNVGVHLLTESTVALQSPLAIPHSWCHCGPETCTQTCKPERNHM